jgi:ABC-type amino acid transport substrate-binding protein|tara:strand:- start:1511 stop:2329 length:819 start_codon:yes stop_codon:yes gene_type:complete
MKNLLAMMFLAFSTLVSAQLPTSTVPLPPDIAAIKKANVLIVSMTKKDNPPFFSGEGDDIKGLDVEIARRIGVLLGVPVQFRRDAESFAEVVEQVREGKADVAVSKLSVTGPRLQVVRFSDPYIKLRQSLVINRLWLSQNSQGREVYQVIRDFNGKISFIRNSSYDTFARINFPNAQFLPEDKWDVIIEKVTKGEIAAAYRDEFEIKKIAFEKPDAAISTKSITISDSVDNIAIAVNPKSIQLLSVVNYVIKNEYNNIDTKKLMDRYKAEKK